MLSKYFKVIIFFYILLLTACGGGGGNKGTVSDSTIENEYESNPPEVMLIFPHLSMMTDNTESLVRGSSKDESFIDSISVNGIKAESKDGFKSWTAKIPLLVGENSLLIEATDEHGNNTVITSPYNIRRSALYTFLGGGDINYNTNEFVASDHTQRNIIKADLLSGNSEIISDNSSIVDGIYFPAIYGVAVDEKRNKVYVLNATDNTVISVNNTDGLKTVLFETSGHELSQIIFDDKNDVLYLLLRSNDVLKYEILTSRLTLLVFNKNTEELADLINVNSIAYHESRNVLFLMDGEGKSIYEADLINLEYKLISSPTFPDSQFDFDNYPDITTSKNGNEIYLIDNHYDRILSIDIDTGSKTMILDTSDTTLGDMGGVIFNESSKHLVVIDSSSALIWDVNPESGAMKKLSSTNFPNDDDQFGGSYAMVLDEKRRELIVTSSYPAAIVAVDVDSGQRKYVVHAGDKSTCEDLWQPIDITLDIKRDKIVTFFYGDNNLVEVNRETGACVNLTEMNIGDEDLKSVEYDSENDNLIVISDSKIFILSAESYEILNTHQGGQSEFSNVEDIEMDYENHRALISSTKKSSISSINLNTGKSELLGSYEYSIISIGGLAIDQQNKRLFTTDRSGDPVHELNLKNLENTVISNINSGISMHMPQNIEYDSKLGFIYIGDYRLNHISVVDIVTGERLILSH
jgi:DNA-binding beta-propeller fold protein YncE